MKVEQIYTGCLAQGAYYISSQGEAAIIDPLREVQPYLDKLEEEGDVLKYIFETHFHADFVSGHVTLSERTGAPIIYGPTAEPNFNAVIAQDSQEFKLGDVIIKVLHTPGHTMESSTFLLLDEKGKEKAIFSGDTLFLGDVGRPDLAQKGTGLTKEKLAGILFDSLRTKIMPLPNNILVYPGHGAGSACGKNMSKETIDTLGNQKETNYALRADMTKEEFIEEVTRDIPEPPAYFPLNAKLNKQGYADFDVVKNKGLTALTPEEFESLANTTEAVILDVRKQDDFARQHIPRSIFIGLNGDFAPWVGAMICDVEQPILLVANEGEEEEAVTRLARVGFDNTLGYLEGGVLAWEKSGRETDAVKQTDAASLLNHQLPIIDVRKETEFLSQHVIGARNIPLAKINQNLDQLPAEEEFYLHCAGGYRSMIAISILKSRGFHNAIDVKGGFNAIKNTDIALSNFRCSSTL